MQTLLRLPPAGPCWGVWPSLPPAILPLTSPRIFGRFYNADTHTLTHTRARTHTLTHMHTHTYTVGPVSLCTEYLGQCFVL